MLWRPLPSAVARRESVVQVSSASPAGAAEGSGTHIMIAVSAISKVESEQYDVAILRDVFFSFTPHLSSGVGGLSTAQ